MRWTTSLLAALAIAGSSMPRRRRARRRSRPTRSQKKIVLVQKHGASQKSRSRARPTLHAGEVNSYLQFKRRRSLPVGVTEPSSHDASAQGRLIGSAVVDLDVVRQKQSSGGWFDPDELPHRQAAGHRHGRSSTRGRQGQVRARDAPRSAACRSRRSFLQEMVNFFTRTADNPNGIVIDDPFELPAEIRRIDVDARHACIDQCQSDDRCMARRRPADALAVSEGRRSAQGRRPQEGRPPHRRRSAVSFPAPLRGSQPPAADHLAAGPGRPWR